MIELKDITIICVDCYNYGKAVDALQKCNQQVKASRTLFLTDIPLQLGGIEVVKIPTIRTKDEYSRFIVKELYKHFDTSHCLVIQHDGYILNGDAWDERFMEYDYIGALWLESDGLECGNGGFSLRSKQLQEVLGTDDHIEVCNPEDVSICRLYRRYLEQSYGFKWATNGVAEKFSFELREPNQKTFGFHGSFHEPYRPTVILKRSAALGDIVQLEPVMRHFLLKGYNIVLDIPAQFWELFNEHYFPIKHISQYDKGRLEAEREINLDQAYEVKPRQNYLKSYFEFCGETDYILTRPNLYPLVSDDTKLFKKYAVVHIDERETLHRNTYGVDWKRVKRHLESLGYFVLQIGKGKHESCGTEINTSSIRFLKFVLAGCDIFVGVDSGPASIAAAYFKKCVLFFGSVTPEYIHANMTDLEIIQGNCDRAGCWHIEGGNAGQECFYKGTDKYLQCCKHETEDAIDAITKLHLK